MTEIKDAVVSRKGDDLPPALNGDADAAAQQLFAVLRGFDDAGARLIRVEAPPAGPAWDGVRDRLQRAAASG